MNIPSLTLNSHTTPGISLIVLLFSNFCFGQQITLEEANRKLASIFKEKAGRPEVLLVGTFHFDYPDQDGYKTPDSMRFDMLSLERQVEINEVVEAISKFKPTIIAIEALPQSQLKFDTLFQKYLAGKLTNERSERFQLGFRLAQKLNLSKVHCIDARPFVKTLYETDTVLAKKYNLEKDTIFAELGLQYERFYNYDDTLQKFMKLKDYLLLINSDNFLKYDNGQYLTYTRNGTNKEPFGADGFISKWFNRNVRIFSNIQRLTISKNDRVLVIFGGGHIPILKFLIESSQEFRLRRLDEYIK